MNGLLTRKQTQQGEKFHKGNDVEKTRQQEMKRKTRGLCFHEVLQVNSCPFDKCMFSHTISEDDRNDIRECMVRMMY